MFVNTYFTFFPHFKNMTIPTKLAKLAYYLYSSIDSNQSWRNDKVHQFSCVVPSTRIAHPRRRMTAIKNIITCCHTFIWNSPLAKISPMTMTSFSLKLCILVSYRAEWFAFSEKFPYRAGVESWNDWKTVDDNNNNNLRLLQLQSNRAIIQYQHPPRRAGNNSRHAGLHYVQKG